MYVGHKNINLQNAPPICKFMSGHKFDISFYLPHQRASQRRATRRRLRFCRTLLLPAPAAATLLATTAARHHRMPPLSPPHAAAACRHRHRIASPSRRGGGEHAAAARHQIASPSRRRGGSTLPPHAVRRSCQEGQIFRGRSLKVSLIPSRIFSLYQQLSGRVWLRCIWQGTPTKGAP